MISSKQFLASKAAKKLPTSITAHRHFRDNKRIPKIFHQLGLPNDRVKNFYNDPEFGMLDLVFSSTGTQCLYDIATMSMRGAMSCMHWENKHSCHVIGSVVDPFCAIIYLTDRKRTTYGRSIIKRSLVRLAARTKDNKPVLFIERPYTKSDNSDPNVYRNECKRPQDILAVFASYFATKTKLEVRHAWCPYVPVFRPLHKSIKDLSYSEHSMSDSGLGLYTHIDTDQWFQNLDRETTTPPSATA